MFGLTQEPGSNPMSYLNGMFQMNSRICNSFYLFVCSFVYLELFVHVWPAYMHVHHMCAWCWRRSGEGIRLPGLGFGCCCIHHVCAENQTRVLWKISKSSALTLRPMSPAHLQQHLKKSLLGQAWWCTPLIPALVRQRQVDF